MILDVVKELMRLGKGDQAVLDRIRRAAEQDEVISFYEREYVGDLVRSHMEPEPAAESYAAGGAELEALPVAAPRPARGGRGGGGIAAALLARKKIIALAAVLLAVGLGGAAAHMSGALVDEAPAPPPRAAAPPAPAASLSVETDAGTYRQGDVLAITGAATRAGADGVALTITNGDGKEVWRETVRPRADWSYSTLTIAGGPGWEEAGTYVASADEGGGAVDASFAFMK